MVSRVLSPPMLLMKNKKINKDEQSECNAQICSVYTLCVVSHLHDTPLYSVGSCSRFFALAPNPAYMHKKDGYNIQPFPDIYFVFLTDVLNW